MGQLRDLMGYLGLYFLPNMLLPPSEVDVSHEKYVKKVPSSSPTISNWTFSDSKIKGYLGLIWANWGLK